MQLYETYVSHKPIISDLLSQGYSSVKSRWGGGKVLKIFGLPYPCS